MSVEVLNGIERINDLSYIANRHAIKNKVSAIAENFQEIFGEEKTKSPNYFYLQAGKRKDGVLLPNLIGSSIKFYFSVSTASFSRGLYIEECYKQAFDYRRQIDAGVQLRRCFEQIEEELELTLIAARRAMFRGDTATAQKLYVQAQKNLSEILMTGELQTQEFADVVFSSKG